MHPRQLLTFSYQPPDNTRHPQTTQDTPRQHQAPPDTVSVGVCWCMLVSIICLEHVGVPGVMFWVYQGDI